MSVSSYMHTICSVGPFKAAISALKVLGVPDLFGLACVIKRKEDVCIFTDAVVSKALQIDEEVVRHRDTTTITMALSDAITLERKKKVAANKSSLYKQGQTFVIQFEDVYLAKQ